MTISEESDMIKGSSNNTAIEIQNLKKIQKWSIQDFYSKPDIRYL